MAMGLTQMNALLSSQNMMKSVANMNSNRNKLQGEMGVLENEIKLDKSRAQPGEDADSIAKDKEERLAEAGKTSENLAGQMGKTTAGVVDKINEDGDKIREEEGKQDDSAKKTEDAQKAGQTGNVDTAKTGEPAAKSGEVAASPVDIAEISMFAHNVAAHAPVPVPEIPVAQPVQIGEIVNAKA